MDEQRLKEEDQRIIAEELALHESVRLAVRKAALAQAPDMSALQQQLVELRDEAARAHERDLPALFQQLYTHHSLASLKFDKKLPDLRSPYFAHLVLEEAGKRRTILIGHQTFIDPADGITIIDWRHAALAKVFFNFREGDDFEIELPGRLAQGRVAVRRLVTFDIGELIGINGPDWSLARNKGEAWVKGAGAEVPVLAGGTGQAVTEQAQAVLGTGATKRRAPEISALLDPQQYEILSRVDRGGLLILGGAGSGKTTVALHRVALLAYRRPKFYNPQVVKVVVPELGLVRLTQRLLRGLGLDGIEVRTFDQWVEAEGRHILKGLPRRLCTETPSVSMTVKRHPAMLAGVEHFVRNLVGELHARARFLFGAWRAEMVDGLVRDDAPLWSRLERFEDQARHALAAPDLEPAFRARHQDLLQSFMKEARARALNVNAARSELYSNPELHATVCAASGGRITPSMMNELARHTRRQFEDQSQGMVDEELLREVKAVDGGEIEADDYADTMDVEDFAVLLDLMLRIHGSVVRKGKSLTLLRHLVIDEAQDVAPVEMRLLGQSLWPDATVTIAGDAAQQSDPNVVFGGWESVMADLGLSEVDQARLSTNYRCPKPIAAFGQMVLGPLAAADAPAPIRDGQPVTVSRFSTEGLAVAAISEALAALASREPRASVAVVCANELSARTWHESLANVSDARLVLEGDFEFLPGVDVTDVANVKGLEFDYVIIPDANADSYPDSPVSRRALHIAVTRAVHQLWVASVGRPSPVIQVSPTGVPTSHNPSA